jgi:hypothetical protein
MLGTQHSRLDITRHAAPHQTRFEPKYFLTLIENGLTLLNLLSQCFQDIRLNKWNNIVRKQFPDNTNLAEANFEGWTWNYLKQSSGAQQRQPTNSLALCCKKPAFMLIHEFMWHQTQPFSYLDNSYLH